jgi:hypothetical protein
MLSNLRIIVDLLVLDYSSGAGGIFHLGAGLTGLLYSLIDYRCVGLPVTFRN